MPLARSLNPVFLLSSDSVTVGLARIPDGPGKHAVGELRRLIREQRRNLRCRQRRVRDQYFIQQSLEQRVVVGFVELALAEEICPWTEARRRDAHASVLRHLRAVHVKPRGAAAQSDCHMPPLIHGKTTRFDRLLSAAVLDRKAQRAAAGTG